MGLSLSKIAYRIALSIYHFFIGIFSVFNEKAYKFTKGRLNQHVAQFEEQTIWFHCASLGEFEQARPLIDYYYKHLKLPIIITFFSPSGYVYKSNYPLARAVYYLPKDNQQNAREFIEKINPKFAIFIKYEFWYFYLEELNRRNIPTFLVSGIFRKSQIFFKSYGTLHKKMLSNFRHLFVQDEPSLKLLEQHGHSNTSHAFDTRFDTVKNVSELNFSNDVIEDFIGKKTCIVVGSSWFKDEKLLKASLTDIHDYKIIIAPHNVNPLRIKQIKKLFPISTCISDPIDVVNQQVLIIDNVGKLSLLYRYAKICFIGGGFGTSVHNVLEAAVYGKPLLYGPNHSKSKEALDLIKIGAATEINHMQNVKASLIHLKSKENYLKASSQARNYVLERTGGTQTVVKGIQQILNS